MFEDSLNEDGHSPVPGLVHRYPDRVLMLVTTQCASYCRYCTRSRIVGDPSAQFSRHDYDRQIDYIAAHAGRSATCCCRGGDPLVLPPKVLEDILRRLRAIEHVEIIRIGSRVPVFMPQRITPELVAMLRQFHPLWMNLHFNHAKELTPEVAKALARLADAGIPLGAQTVLLAGVNDSVEVMKELVHKLVRNRVRPYYLYQCDLVEGAGHFRTTVSKGIEIIEGLRGPHQRLRHPDLRGRCARRRRQDPGHAAVPDQPGAGQGGAAQLRGLHHHLRRAERLHRSHRRAARAAGRAER